MAWDRFMEAVLEGLNIPEAEHVYFCLEPLTSRLTNFLNTPDEVARMLREMRHPQVKMILDTYSMNAEGVDMPAAIRKHKDWLYHVHVNDDNQLGPGYGSIDFVPVLRALQDIGYERYVSVEIFDFSRDTVEVARNSLAHLKQCLEKAGGGAR
jgi:sugar phosphate isomerase/epimerase